MTQSTLEQPGQWSDDAARWAAVMERDPAADGAFCYAVRTTGIYCRPSCPARRARRRNVIFFDHAEQAERAGFRACRRCRPDTAAARSRHAAIVAAACRRMETAETMPDLDALARDAGLSRYHFHRVFKAATGITPKAYAQALRTRRMRRELAGHGRVTDAVYAAGYSSGARFYADAAQHLGMTPTEFRSGGKGRSIRFAVAECWLGPLLVAATDKGICAIRFGDDPQALVHELQDDFSAARLIAGDRDFEQLVARVVGLVEAPEQTADLPLDIRGSAFQQRVWQALRQIPPGTTASYADIARRIGQPRAARAVARACAGNGIAVAVPCHRVVRSDGALSGYRWGVDRKRALLDRERGA